MREIICDCDVNSICPQGRVSAQDKCKIFVKDKLPEIRIVFDGPPGEVSGRFIEVENEYGKSISIGSWRKRSSNDDWWELVIRI